MAPLIEIVLPSYGVFACIGLFFSLILLFYRMNKFEITYRQLACYLVIGIICLLIGSRIMFAIAMIPTMENGFSLGEFVGYLINGGIVFYGGMIGGLAGIAITAKLRKENLNHMYAFAAPAFPLFHAWARLGCLFGGCCYGIEWPWGVVMAASPEIVRFPVQFVESMCDALIFIAILIYEHKYPKGIKGIYIYLFSYAVCRFILEFFRGDQIRGIWGILSKAQIISVVILIVCAVKGIRNKRTVGGGYSKAINYEGEDSL